MPLRVTRFRPVSRRHNAGFRTSSDLRPLSIIPPNGFPAPHPSATRGAQTAFVLFSTFLDLRPVSAAHDVQTSINSRLEVGTSDIQVKNARLSCPSVLHTTVRSPSPNEILLPTRRHKVPPGLLQKRKDRSSVGLTAAESGISALAELFPTPQFTASSRPSAETEHPGVPLVVVVLEQVEESLERSIAASTRPKSSTYLELSPRTNPLCRSHANVHDPTEIAATTSSALHNGCRENASHGRCCQFPGIPDGKRDTPSEPRPCGINMF
jgi:hypothetical protein